MVFHSWKLSKRLSHLLKATLVCGRARVESMCAEFQTLSLFIFLSGTDDKIADQPRKSGPAGIAMTSLKEGRFEGKQDGSVGKQRACGQACPPELRPQIHAVTERRRRNLRGAL